MCLPRCQHVVLQKNPKRYFVFSCLFGVHVHCRSNWSLHWAQMTKCRCYWKSTDAPLAATRVSVIHLAVALTPVGYLSISSALSRLGADRLGAISLLWWAQWSLVTMVLMPKDSQEVHESVKNTAIALALTLLVNQLMLGFRIWCTNQASYPESAIIFLMKLVNLPAPCCTNYHTLQWEKYLSRSVFLCF